MSRRILACGLLIGALLLAVLAVGCVEEGEITGEEGEATSSLGALTLTTYTDPIYYFSIKKPADWSVTVGDAIVVADPASSGATLVTIQPLILSGAYRSMDAEAIANYLVGDAIAQYEHVEFESVRETSDQMMLELVALFTDDGMAKKGVYTIFVASPYAIYTSYETLDEDFAELEELLRTIASSYVQNTPPDGATGSGAPQSTIGPLHETTQEGKVKMRVPDGWKVTVLPGCTGLYAEDTANPARGVIFLNFLHADLNTGLPPGVTPEEYLTEYLPQDFTTVSAMKMLHYEDADVSFLSAGASSEVKAMRASFNNQGVPAVGSFMIGTRQIGGYYTTVDYLWGIYAPADQFEVDAPILLEIANSIDYSESILGQCRSALEQSWGGTGRSSGGTGSSGDELREQRLNEWYERQEKEDIFMEEYSDFILNRDRVYNPETDEVYHVNQNFYQYYDTHREQYKQKYMVELTGEQFRTHVPLDGNLHILPE
jgi:hypothetical protein